MFRPKIEIPYNHEISKEKHISMIKKAEGAYFKRSYHCESRGDDSKYEVN